jgi:hypothetical protein
MSAAVNLPIIARVARDSRLTGRLAWVLGGVALLGLAGMLLQQQLPMLSESLIPGGILGRDYPEVP